MFSIVHMGLETDIPPEFNSVFFPAPALCADQYYYLYDTLVLWLIVFLLVMEVLNIKQVPDG